MPLSETERKKCVETLLNAEKEKKQAVQLSVTYPHISIEDSYAISTAVAQHRIKAGARLIGHKVDRKSTRLNSSHLVISYAVFCLKKKKKTQLKTITK